MFEAEEYKGASQIWLLSGSEEGESVVKNGSYKDKTIGQVFEELGKGFGGAKYDEKKPFPLFIRLIDAKDSLPLEVCTKERLIYIAFAEPDAQMIYGFSHNINNEEIRRRLSSNTLFPACNLVSVKSGDIIKIPAGLLCAVGKGILCYEISFTESNFYTISDYGRADAHGNRSPINTAQALRYIYLGASGGNVKSDDTFLYPFGTVSEANLSNAAHISLIRLAGSAGIYENDSFMSVIVTDGSVMFSYPSGNMHLKTGDSILIPARTNTKFAGYANLLCSHI